jgi:hypothetical protein
MGTVKKRLARLEQRLEVWTIPVFRIHTGPGDPPGVEGRDRFTIRFDVWWWGDGCYLRPTLRHSAAVVT